METTDLSGLVGLTEAALVDRLGDPEARQDVGGERWLVFDLPGLTLRVRCAADGPDGARTVRSWSAALDRAGATLRQAVEPLGLWPACAPDERADDLDAPLARRGLPAGEDGPERSLTAVLGADGFRRVAVFDEPPEWT